MTNHETSSAHTTGSWFLAHEGDTFVVKNCESDDTNDGVVICEIYDMDDPAETQANARLLSSAPGLLEACELLVHSLGNWLEIAEEHDMRDHDKEAMQKGVAAIIKARAGR